jgi:hypothetical protein
MNHFIPLSIAAEMTAKFRGERENILKTEYQQQNVLPVNDQSYTVKRRGFQLEVPASCWLVGVGR